MLRREDQLIVQGYFWLAERLYHELPAVRPGELAGEPGTMAAVRNGRWITWWAGESGSWLWLRVSCCWSWLQGIPTCGWNGNDASLKAARKGVWPACGCHSKCPR